MKTQRWALCLLVSMSALTSGACLSIDRDLIGTQLGCDELKTGDVGTVPDARVRTLVEAAFTFGPASKEMRAAVLEVCAGLARDLGANDDYGDIEDANERVANEDGTGACDVANAALSAVLEETADAGIHIGLAVSEGACYPDVAGQAECESVCANDSECEPGPLEERCAPDSLSVQCHGVCDPNAYCAGSPDLPANCQGICESTCEGGCEGNCIALDGSVTEDDPNCLGKCSAACSGSCRGMCRVEAADGIDCGSDVACLGGCTGDYGEPKCAGELTPSECDVEEECYVSCAATATAKANCALPHVEIYVDVEAMAEGKLDGLVTTLETHLPTLIWAGRTHGIRARDAIESLTLMSVSLMQRVAGKSRTCAGDATGATFQALRAVTTSVDASAKLVETITAYTE